MHTTTVVIMDSPCLQSEFESLDEEVRELLLNYKLKMTTVYQPCTLKNIKECLIGLSEEFERLNLNYVFNPYCDIVTEQTLHPEALVTLINAVWTLLQNYKTTAEKAEKLVEKNHVLDHVNKLSNGIIGRLKEKVNAEKHTAKKCTDEARRISDHSDEMAQTLAETKAKLVQVHKQKETTEKRLRHEIARLKIENEKLSDRLRSKSGIFTPCSEVCDSTVLSLKERDRKQLALIGKLQRNNQELLKEVLDMKETIILHGIK